jgi:outer membrane protein OmpA-like peptidoglycan-associated protein/tetratricopeptide (TPR) repeat protein
MKLIFSFLFIIGFTLTGISQSVKLKKADKLYDLLAYKSAADTYEELVAKNQATDHVYKRMADCYNKIGYYEKAEKSYKVLYDQNKLDPEETYAYSQILKANGKDSLAEHVLDKFNNLKSTDSRAKEFISRKSEFYKIKNSPPYFTVRAIQGNSVEADFSPSYWKDKIVFVSNRVHSLQNVRLHSLNDKPFLDLFSAKNDSLQNFTQIQKFDASINSKYHEGPSCFTKDGNTIYFTRNNFFKGKYRKSKTGINMLELFKATNKNGKWATEKLSIDNDDYSVGHPSLSADEKTLYFASDMPGGFGGTDIWMCTINADGTLGATKNMGEIVNTEGNELFPFMSNDGTLFFSSNGHLGFGELDVFAAVLDKENRISKVMNLGVQVNSGKDDFGFILDKDGKFGYLSSNRDGGLGDDDIYAISAIRPLKQNYVVKGIAYEKGTTTPLINTKIEFKDKNGTVISSIVTDASGNYQFEIEQSKEYVLEGSKSNYFNGNNSFNSNELGDKNELIKDVYLEKDPGFSVYALITDTKTKAALEGAKVIITNLADNSSFADFTTPNSGDFIKAINNAKIGDKLSFSIQLQKKGYLNKTVTFNKTISKPGQINIHEEMDLTLSKLEIGADLAKMIDIKPIYFDLGKYNIRPDAAKELDKIIKVMNEYPTMYIELGSHTDCRSSYESNMKLSDNRAKSSAEYISQKISNPERISGKGYGETKLINGCACEGAVKSKCTEAEHQANRRTEFIILKIE